MSSFWSRFFRLFGAFVVDELRRAATVVEELLPGEPTFSFLVFNVGGAQMQNPTVPDNHPPFPAAASFLDAENNPTTLAADETATWASSDETIATVEADPTDQTKATVTLTGALGVVQVSVDSKNESGADVTSSGQITVVASDEASASIDFQV